MFAGENGMKLLFPMLLFFASILFIGCTTLPPDFVNECKKEGTAYSMQINEAFQIAQNSECKELVPIGTNNFCNSGTGTYWIDVEKKKEGCNPMCVVNVETKQAEINWMCTGAIDPSVNPNPSENPSATIDPTIPPLPTDEPTITPNPTNQPANVADYPFEMYAALNEPNKNVFFSPFSISQAFSILYEGAKSESAKELEKVFGFEPNAAIRQTAIKQTNDRLNKPNANYSLSIANALFVQKDFKLLDSYTGTVKSIYDGAAENLDFVGQPAQSASRINNWCSEKTNGKITKVLEPSSITPDLRLVIANAIYFKGNWLLEFDLDNTKKRDFRVSSSQTKQVDTMFTSDVDAGFSYMENDQLQMLKMPYKGNKISMLVLLPKEDDLAGLEKDLSTSNLNAWKTQLQKKKVDVYLPKFKIETFYDLNKPLKEMGLDKIFKQGAADLSGIDGSKELYVGFALHKAFVEVNEKGTEAAAVTVIGVVGASMPQKPLEFKADHPFIFIIQEDATGEILFMGKIDDPTA